MTKLSKEEIETLKHIHLQWTLKEGVSRGQIADSLNILSLISYIDAIEAEATEISTGLMKQVSDRTSQRNRLASRVERLRAALTELSKPFLQNLEMTITLEDAKRAIAEDDQEAGK